MAGGLHPRPAGEGWRLRPRHRPPRGGGGAGGRGQGRASPRPPQPPPPPPPPPPLAAALHRRSPGLRITKTPAVFEALLPTVFEQKVIGAEARNGYMRLIRALGEPAPGPAGMTVPPAAARLARTPYFELHRFALERRRAATVARAARRAHLRDACRDPN